MLQNKALLLFLLKAAVFYALLSAPFSLYDKAYGMFYRQVAGYVFHDFRDGGFVMFRELDDPATTHVLIGSYALLRPDKTTETLERFVNTRYLGYIPTVLLISLVLASPVPWKRMIVALAAGLLLVTMLILFKQWISLLWHCEHNKWLNLTNFSGTRQHLFMFIYGIVCASSSTVLYFVVAIWLLATFRLDDFKTVKEKIKRDSTPLKIPGKSTK